MHSNRILLFPFWAHFLFIHQFLCSCRTTTAAGRDSYVVRIEGSSTARQTAKRRVAPHPLATRCSGEKKDRPFTWRTTSQWKNIVCQAWYFSNSLRDVDVDDMANDYCNQSSWKFRNTYNILQLTQKPWVQMNKDIIWYNQPWLTGDSKLKAFWSYAMQGMISTFLCDSCLQHIWSIPATSWQTGLRYQEGNRTSRPKILCLVEMFSVFFRPFFTTGQPTAYGLPCSSPYFQDLESWNGATFFWRSVKVFFCARLGLNTACKHACTVQKCAKYKKHFSILTRDISRCFTLGLNLKENWKPHDVHYLFVSLQNRGYKEMSGSRIWAETILTKVYKFIIKERSTKFSQQSREAKKTCTANSFNVSHLWTLCMALWSVFFV